MKTILYVHQSADLYGSDKTLLMLLDGLDLSRFCPLVALPEQGPLADELNNRGIKYFILPVGKLRRAALTPWGILRLFSDLQKSLRQIDKALAHIKIDLVHSNTLAVLGGALWARWRHVPHVWHVHEIVEHPRIANYGFCLLLDHFADIVACNSKATMEHLIRTRPQLSIKAQVFMNGLPSPGLENQIEAAQLRRALGIQEDEILVALVGRFNRLKGHHVLLDAVFKLRASGQHRFHLLFAGSSPAGQEQYADDIRERIHATGADGFVHMLNYQKDVNKIWQACDIAVVPSIEPESFGLTALEAMTHCKPVIASAHGGLVDIIEPGYNGLLVPPGDADALAEALRLLIQDAQLRARFGKNGRFRFIQEFSIEQHVAGFERMYDQIRSHHA